MAEELPIDERIDNVRQLMQHPGWREIDAMMRSALEAGMRLLPQLVRERQTDQAEKLAARLDFIERFVSQPVLLIQSLTQMKEAENVGSTRSDPGTAGY